MAEGASIYRIAVEILGDDREASTVFSTIAEQLRQIRAEADGTREALRDISGGLGAAADRAREFRDAMHEARSAAEGMAQTTRQSRGSSSYRDYWEAGETPRPSASRRGEESPEEERPHYRAQPTGPGLTPYSIYTAASGAQRQPIDAEWTEVRSPLGIGYQSRPSQDGSAGRGVGGGAGGPPGEGSEPSPGEGGNPRPPGEGGNPRPPRNPGGANVHAAVSPWDVWYFGRMAGDALVRPAYDVAQDRAVLSARLSAADTAMAFRTISRVQEANPATSISRNTALYNALLSMTQDPKEAAEFLGAIVPYGVALSQINPERGDYATQLEQVARTAEFLGFVTTRNPDGTTRFNSAATSDFLQRSVALANLTRGQFSPQALLSFMKRAGPAARELDLNDLAGMFPIVQEQQMTHGGSASGAGTMLLGFNRQFAQGRMSEAAVNMLIRMGIIKGGGGVGAAARRAGLAVNPYVVSHGMGNWMVSPQGYADGQFDAIMHHPTQFIAETLLPAIDRQIAKERHLHDLSGLSREERIGLETNAAAALTSNQPGAQFITAVIANQDTIRRELEAARSAPNADAAMRDLQNTPATSMAAFSNSFSALMATLGSPLMNSGIHALDGLTYALTTMNRAATEHPLSFGAPTTALFSGAAATVATGSAALFTRVMGSGASFLGLEKVAPLLIRGAAAIARFAPYVGLVVTALEGLYEVYKYLSVPEHQATLANYTAGLQNYLFGSHASDAAKAYLAPAQINRSGWAGEVLNVYLTNPQDVASGAATYAARSIATPHAQSPHDHTRSVPQSPGSHN